MTIFSKVLSNPLKSSSEVVTQLAEEIVLHSKSFLAPVSFVFRVDNQSEEVLHFHFDFSRSTNLRISVKNPDPNDHPTKISVTIKYVKYILYCKLYYSHSLLFFWAIFA